LPLLLPLELPLLLPLPLPLLVPLALPLLPPLPLPDSLPASLPPLLLAPLPLLALLPLLVPLPLLVLLPLLVPPLLPPLPELVPRASSPELRSSWGAMPRMELHSVTPATKPMRPNAHNVRTTSRITMCPLLEDLRGRHRPASSARCSER